MDIQEELLEWWQEEMRNENYAKAGRIFDVINRIADRRWNYNDLY
ncbi:MAG: hypothetical protein ACFFD2_17210 [Promethearchaeota archaeon]